MAAFNSLMLGFKCDVKGELSKVELEGLVHTTINCSQAIPIWFNTKSKISPLLFYSLLKIFCVINFHRVSPATKAFYIKFFPNYGIAQNFGKTNVIYNALSNQIADLPK